MCGILGYVAKTTVRHEKGSMILNAMKESLQHRGPDKGGIWLDEQMGVGLGHRRLSILDLSDAGDQPMISSSGRFVITFNGEIYNFQDLRAELDSLSVTPGWRGHSDTEVLLAGIEHWGLKTALQKSNGMFALALLDRKEKSLFLARDRMGEKPLYYGWQGGTFLFASEIKALKHHPAWRGKIDHGALTLYMRHSYIPSPYSIYKGISKLAQGTFLRLDFAKKEQQPLIPEPFWSLQDAVFNGMKDPFLGDEKEAVDELERLLLDAVGKQMIADVPLGVFLSGGYDSSLITALMQAQSTKPVKTFTIGFQESRYDEAPYAKAVAKHLGTDHSELYVTYDDALNVIHHLPLIYDEPFADSSQIPTLLLSKMAKKHVTVALTGDGGDELMRGYQKHYERTFKIWKYISKCPIKFRMKLASFFEKTDEKSLNRAFSFLRFIFPDIVDNQTIGYRLRQLGQAGSINIFSHYYRYMVSVCKIPEALLHKPHDPKTLYDEIDPGFWGDDYNALMLYMDEMTYLPDDLLVKVDRASMAVSLETRMPMLDHRVVEFIWRLPDKFRWRNGISKWALRQIARKYIPAILLERPKKGFSVPVADWLRGSLLDWTEETLSEKNLRKQALFNTDIIRNAWQEHHKEKKDRINILWPVLMAKELRE